MLKRTQVAKPLVSEPTEGKHRNLIPFKPGQSGNPRGRPRGARNKLGEEVLADLYEDFAMHKFLVAAKLQLATSHQRQIRFAVIAYLVAVIGKVNDSRVAAFNRSLG